MKKISIINGPNLNLLGEREPDVYGTDKLTDIMARAVAHGQSIGFKVSSFQSNSEGEIVDAIQHAAKDAAGLVINPAGYTHTSVAIRDALASTDIPIIEVHLSNIYKREEFRQHSYVSGVATGVISGLGAVGYNLALDALAELIK